MKDQKLYLIHILECIQYILEYTKDGEAVFHQDRKTRDAVMRNFEIMGEAAKRISEEIKKDHPEIPWRQVAGFRDILIHQYEGVDTDEVWQIIAKDLLPLRKNVDAVLKKLS